MDKIHICRTKVITLNRNVQFGSNRQIQNSIPSSLVSSYFELCSNKLKVASIKDLLDLKLDLVLSLYGKDVN